MVSILIGFLSNKNWILLRIKFYKSFYDQNFFQWSCINQPRQGEKTMTKILEENIWSWSLLSQWYAISRLMNVTLSVHKSCPYGTANYTFHKAQINFSPTQDQNFRRALNINNHLGFSFWSFRMHLHRKDANTFYTSNLHFKRSSQCSRHPSKSSSKNQDDIIILKTWVLSSGSPPA